MANTFTNNSALANTSQARVRGETSEIICLVRRSMTLHIPMRAAMFPLHADRDVGENTTAQRVGMLNKFRVNRKSCELVP